MTFDLNKSLEILERTPHSLEAMLSGLSEDWTSVNEGPGTWSVFDVMGHLIHGELTDWVPRAKLILSNSESKVFEPFDRFAQFKASKGKSIMLLLTEFSLLRKRNLEWVRAHVTEDHLHLKGMHPALGETTLAQLLATWTVHDLNHLTQIARVMAHQYKDEVGPWVAYLGILNR